MNNPVYQERAFQGLNGKIKLLESIFQKLIGKTIGIRSIVNILIAVNDWIILLYISNRINLRGKNFLERLFQSETYDKRGWCVLTVRTKLSTYLTKEHLSLLTRGFKEKRKKVRLGGEYHWDLVNVAEGLRRMGINIGSCEWAGNRYKQEVSSLPSATPTLV